MDERRAVRELLAAAGIVDVPDDDFESLVRSYGRLRRAAAVLFAVDCVDEEPGPVP